MQNESSAQEAPSAHILWQRRFAYALWSDVVVLADGLIAVQDHPDGAQLHRVEASTGQSRWVLSLGKPLGFPLVRVGRHIYTTPTSGELIGIEIATGTQCRLNPPGLTGRLTGPCASKNTVIFLRSETGNAHEILAIDTQTETILWRIPDPSQGTANAQCSVTMDRLLFAWSSDGVIHVTAISTSTGEAYWRTSNIEGECLELWALCERIDVVTLGEGIVALDFNTGKVRNKRYRPLEYSEATLAGEHLLASLKDEDGRFLRSTHTLIGPPLGEVRKGFQHVIGADCSAVLIEHTDGYPEMFSLPHLQPVTLRDVKLVGPTAAVFWARDTAYFLGKDGHTLTGVDRVRDFRA